MAMSAMYTTINGVLYHENRGGVETEYVPDTLGSLIQCRNSSGTATYTAEYWPYGEVRTETGSKSAPWGFVGLLGYLTDQAKRLYVRARHLRVDLGQWITVDPLWPSEMPYGYADKSPCQMTDSYGFRPQRGDSDWGFLIPFPGHPRWIRIPWDLPTLLPPFDPDLITPICNQVNMCKDCLDGVYNEMRIKFPGSKGVNNSLRHCVGACISRRRCGATCSKAIYAHEPQSWIGWDPLLGFQPNLPGIVDSVCDIFNNEKGFAISQGSTTCEQGCRDALKSSKLCIQ